MTKPPRSQRPTPPTFPLPLPDYERHLVPLPPAGRGVCLTCRTPVHHTFTHCYLCTRASRLLPATADATAFIALAIRGRQLAYDLGAYKSNPHAPTRKNLQRHLGDLVSMWIERHERCLARASGAGDRFDVVTRVPGSRAREGDPLADVLSRSAPQVRERAQPLLLARDRSVTGRLPRRELFRSTSRIAELSVLLVDDTWTTGAHAQSAAAALRVTGAGPVGILTIGRHIGFRAGSGRAPLAAQYLRAADARPWTWRVCALCAPPPAGEVAA